MLTSNFIILPLMEVSVKSGEDQAIADVSRDLKTGFTFFALLIIILGFTYCIRDINPGIGFGGLVYLGAMAAQYALASIGIILLGASGIVYEREIRQATLTAASKV